MTRHVIGWKIEKCRNPGEIIRQGPIFTAEHVNRSLKVRSRLRTAEKASSSGLESGRPSMHQPVRWTAWKLAFHCCEAE